MTKDDRGEAKQSRSRRSKAQVSANDPAVPAGPAASQVEVVAEQPTDHANHAPSSKDGYQLANRIKDWFTRGNRPFTVIVAVSTAVNVGVAVFQWRAMEQQTSTMISQNELMIDLAWLERRPWVNIEMPVLKELVADKPLEFEFSARNSGPTPAYITHQLFHINNANIAPGAKGLSYEPPPGDVLAKKSSAQYPPGNRTSASRTRSTS